MCWQVQSFLPSWSFLWKWTVIIFQLSVGPKFHFFLIYCGILFRSPISLVRSTLLFSGYFDFLMYRHMHGNKITSVVLRFYFRKEKVLLEVDSNSTSHWSLLGVHIHLWLTQGLLLQVPAWWSLEIDRLREDLRDQPAVTGKPDTSIDFSQSFNRLKSLHLLGFFSFQFLFNFLLDFIV